MKLKDFDIQISGLKNDEVHTYTIEFNPSIYELMSPSVEDPLEFDAIADITIKKEQTKMECSLTVSASLKLKCDYTDRVYTYPLKNSFEWLVKFGNAANFDDDEIWVVTLDQYCINLFDVIKDTFFLGVPTNRKHPDLSNEDIERYYDKISDSMPKNEESDFGKLLKESMKKR